MYKGALYSCDNLEYESDYCGFNRKCLYALAKIGTNESINFIKEVIKNGNHIVSNYAKKILEEYKFWFKMIIKTNIQECNYFNKNL